MTTGNIRNRRPPAHVVGKAARKETAAQNSEPLDRTAYEEAQLNKLDAQDRKAPYFAEKIAKLKDYRKRERASLKRTGKRPEPAWGLWSEFEVTLTTGETVQVLYDPCYTAQGVNTGTAQAQFFGPLTTTGYRNHFFLDRRGELNNIAETLGGLVPYLEFIARRVHDETVGAYKKLKAKPRAESKAAKERAEQMAFLASEPEDAEDAARELGLI